MDRVGRETEQEAQVLDRPKPDSGASKSPVAVETPAIELRNVSMDYELEGGGTVNALRDVSLSVEAGQIVCVVGPSGHGKTTMLSLIAGFATPSSGEIRTHGRPVTSPGPDRGVIFQRDTLFLWKRVRDNIEFGPKARGVPEGRAAAYSR
jgi:NitT/TauT family transport system ATP-binding protein